MIFRGEKRKESSSLNGSLHNDGTVFNNELELIAQIKRFKINCTPGELR